MAKETALKAREWGHDWLNNDINDLRDAIEIYQSLGDDKTLLELYQKAIELSPQDAQLWAKLAAAYANIGNYEKAREAAAKVKEINPELAPNIEEFLKQLQ